MCNNTVTFTFNDEYCAHNDIIDYFMDVDDETGHLFVYVNDVADYIIRSLDDTELCEFFGLDPEYLIHVIRN